MFLTAACVPVPVNAPSLTTLPQPERFSLGVNASSRRERFPLP